MERRATFVEGVTALVVLMAVAVQAWVLVDGETHGALSRAADDWWRRQGRPRVVRLREWLNAAEITEDMVAREIIPYLERSDGK